MDIRAVVMDRWKGQTCEYRTDRLNLLTGPNGSGKTAIMEAIRWTLTGTSAVGKRPDAAIVYGDGTGCGASVSIGDVEYARSLKLDNRDGTVKQSLTISGHPGIGIREAEAIVRQNIGDFIPMWDLGEFLAMSPDKRRDFILDLCAKACPKKADHDEIMNRVWSVAVAELLDVLNAESLAEEQTDAVSRQLKSIRDSISAEINADLTVAIGGALVRARDMMNAAKAGADGAAEACRRLSDRLAQVRVAAESVDELRSRMKEFDQELRRLNKELAAALAREPMRKSSADALARATEQLRRVCETLDLHRSENVEDEMATALSLETQAEDVRKAIAAIQEPADESDELNRKRVEIMREIESAREAESAAISRYAAAQVREETLDYRIRSIDQSPWMEALRLVSDLMGPDRNISEYPEHVVKTLVKLLELCERESKSDKRAEFQEELAQARAERAKQGRLRDDATAGIERLASELRALDVEIERARAQSVEASRKRTELLEEACRLEAAAKEIRDRLAMRDREIASLVEKQRALTAQCDELKMQIRELETPVDIEALRSSISDVESRVNACREAIEAKERFAALSAELQTMIASAERERITYEAAKAITKGIKVVRDELMSELVSPLVNEINEFFRGDGRTAYCRMENSRGSPVLEFGLGDGAREVSLEHMSGGESVLFSAALSYALIRMADVPLKVLMIEAAEVDHNVFSRLLNALESVSHGVSNVFVATCGYAIGSDAWNTINLWKETPVQEIVV